MSRRGWLLFAAMCVIWGIPYMLIKVAVADVTPAVMVLGRTAVATALLLPIAAYRGQMRGLRAAWVPLVAYTAVEICGPWLLLGYAETRLSSSLTGLLIAAVPMVGAVLGRFSGERERLSPVRISGLLVGLLGVAALVGLDLGSTDLAAVGALALVAVGYAVGPMILARKLADLPQLGVVAASVGLCALVYLPFGLAQAPSEMPAPKVLASVAALGVICTALAFVLFFQLIAEIGPARSTVITYVNPAVAVLLGVLVLDEPFTAAIGVGFVLVLFGSVLATSGRRIRELEPAAGGRPEVAVCTVPEP